MAHDPYSVLGVPRTARPAEIKAAFRKLAKQYHPDLNRTGADADAKFRAVSAAYALLFDPALRMRFDRGDIDAEGKPCQRPFAPDTQGAYSEAGHQHADEAGPAFVHPRTRDAEPMHEPYMPKRADPFRNWGAVALSACLLAFILASRDDHSWRGSAARAWCAIVLVLFLIRWGFAGLRSLRLDGAAQGCLGLAVLLGTSAAWSFADRSLNGRFERAGYPPFFGDFVGLVCLVTSVLLCVQSTRRWALGGFAAFLLAGCILGVMQGQATQVRVTLIVLPVCIGLLLASETRAT